MRPPSALPPPCSVVRWPLLAYLHPFDAGFNGFACAAADLDMPHPAADPGLARYAQGLVDAQSSARSSVQQQVRKAIYRMLPTGRATCEAAAQGLGTSLRALQRRRCGSGRSRWGEHGCGPAASQWRAPP